jgi:reactive intermediate/imine deaminase
VIKQAIYTNKAPEPIGPYSQAVQCGNFVFVSGQIPINPANNNIENATIEEQVVRAFENLKAVCESSGASLQHIVKLNLYLTNLAEFGIVNQIMTEYFTKPYPARSTVEVSALPKGVNFEVDAILVKENV